MTHKPPDAGASQRPSENVADYPRPPALDRVPWMIRVEFRGILVAQTQRALRVRETFGAPVYYIPPQDVRLEFLGPETGTSYCEWKGVARYWSVHVGDRVASRAGWSYSDPTPRFRPLRDHVAFYAGKLDCWVDEDRAEAQPGGFYGGWVTPEIEGPVKGGPGTHHW